MDHLLTVFLMLGGSRTSQSWFVMGAAAVHLRNVGRLATPASRHVTGRRSWNEATSVARSWVFILANVPSDFVNPLVSQELSSEVFFPHLCQRKLISQRVLIIYINKAVEYSEYI